MHALQGDGRLQRTYKFGPFRLYSRRRLLAGRLSESVADALGLNPLPDLGAGLRRQETASREAQERFFFGKYHLGIREGSRARQAEEAFRAAIALDPQYARTYAGLAHALVAVTWLDNRPAVDGMAGAKAAALEALRLDDSLAEAHAALGVVQHAFDFDHESAEESLPSNRKAKRVW